MSVRNIYGHGKSLHKQKLGYGIRSDFLTQFTWRHAKLFFEHSAKDLVIGESVSFQNDSNRIISCKEFFMNMIDPYEIDVF